MMHSAEQAEKLIGLVVFWIYWYSSQ